MKKNKSLYRKKGVNEAVGREMLGSMFQVPSEVGIDKLTNEREPKPTIIVEPLQVERVEQVK